MTTQQCSVAPAKSLPWFTDFFTFKNGFNILIYAVTSARKESLSQKRLGHSVKPQLKKGHLLTCSPFVSKLYSSSKPLSQFSVPGLCLYTKSPSTSQTSEMDSSNSSSPLPL